MLDLFSCPTRMMSLFRVSNKTNRCKVIIVPSLPPREDDLPGELTSTVQSSLHCAKGRLQIENHLLQPFFFSFPCPPHHPQPPPALCSSTCLVWRSWPRPLVSSQCFAGLPPSLGHLLQVAIMMMMMVVMTTLMLNNGDHHAEWQCRAGAVFEATSSLNISFYLAGSFLLAGPCPKVHATVIYFAKLSSMWRCFMSENLKSLFDGRLLRSEIFIQSWSSEHDPFIFPALCDKQYLDISTFQHLAIPSHHLIFLVQHLVFQYDGIFQHHLIHFHCSRCCKHARRRGAKMQNLKLTSCCIVHPRPRCQLKIHDWEDQNKTSTTKFEMSNIAHGNKIVQGLRRLTNRRVGLLRNSKNFVHLLQRYKNETFRLISGYCCLWKTQ